MRTECGHERSTPRTCPGSTSAGRCATTRPGCPASVTSSSRPELQAVTWPCASTASTARPRRRRSCVARWRWRSTTMRRRAPRRDGSADGARAGCSLYAASATTRSRTARSFAGTGGPTYRVWAPTAKTVTLLTWAATASGDAPMSAAKRTAMIARNADGSWSVTAGAKNARYVYEVVVYARSTGKIETVRVTDPYSVALSLNSTRSVAANLKDVGLPAQRLWATTKQPGLRSIRRTPQSTSCTCATSRSPTPRVPTEQRGSYLAFNTATARACSTSRRCAAAGLNTIHLLPTFDIASIQEDPAKQSTPQCDLGEHARRTARSSRRASTRSAATTPSTGATTPGIGWRRRAAYASTPAAADGGKRVAEFRAMVGGAPPGRAAGGPRPGVQPHPHVGAGGHQRAGQGRAGLLPAARTRRGDGRDLDVLPEHRHGAPAGAAGHGRRRCDVGARLQDRRLPVRPDGSPLARPTCSRSARL
jgi:hypothetical protein